MRKCDPEEQWRAPDDRLVFSLSAPTAMFESCFRGLEHVFESRF